MKILWCWCEKTNAKTLAQKRRVRRTRRGRKGKRGCWNSTTSDLLFDTCPKSHFLCTLVPCILPWDWEVATLWSYHIVMGWTASSPVHNAEVLSPNASEYGCYLERGPLRWWLNLNKAFRMSLIQPSWYPHKKRKFGHTQTPGMLEHRGKTTGGHRKKVASSSQGQRPQKKPVPPTL